jgi:ATP-dependent DNA helicase PIF1
LHLLGWNERALRVHPEALAKDADFRRASEAEATRIASLGSDKTSDLHQAHLRDLKESALAPSREGASAVTSRVGNAYKKWSAEDDADIAVRHKRGETVKAMAAALGRQEGGIRARLVKLGLILK